MGAWIEIFYGYDGDIKIIPVAPFVGAWIEIAAIADVLDAYASHPLWVRGLKYLMMLLYLMYERTLLEKVTVGDLIVCSEFSRLGRNLFIIMEILNQCMTKECRVGR